MDLKEGYTFIIRAFLCGAFLTVAYAGIRKTYKKKGLMKWILVLSIISFAIIPVAMVFSIGFQEIFIIAVIIAAIFLFP